MPSARATAVKVLQSLRTAGFEAYFAGGCVRDELLGLHPKDYDVATDATPDDVRRLFKRTNEVGVSFGVMLVRESMCTIEVTTFRKEGAYSDRRRPDDVTYADAPSDARRRDFTINALYLDPLAAPGSVEKEFGVHGKIIDFVQGLEDLRRHVVRAVGDPEHRLDEDHLRALRAVRFAARLGFEIEHNTQEAIRRFAQRLEGVSRERIGDEVRRMLCDPTRHRAVRLMESLGLDGPVLNEPPLGGHSSHSNDIVGQLASNADFETSLTAWAVDRELRRSGVTDGSCAVMEHSAAVPRLRKALCLSNDERDVVKQVLELLALIQFRWSGLPIAERKRAASLPSFDRAIQILRAIDADAAEMAVDDRNTLASDGIGLSPEPLVTGEDLIAAGAEPGPALGRALRALYDQQLEGRIRTRDGAIVAFQAMGANPDAS